MVNEKPSAAETQATGRDEKVGAEIGRPFAVPKSVELQRLRRVVKRVLRQVELRMNMEEQRCSHSPSP